MATQNQRQPKRRVPQGVFHMPPEPPSISSANANPPSMMPSKMPTYPTMQASPSMIHAIKQSRKGKIPPGLAKYLAAHKKGGK